MDELIAQFLLEARDLADQATDDLLALEARPADRARLDGAFRAFHTLKGGAGIVGFDAMARVLHAAEDALAALRGGGAPVTPRLIGDCLACLDQVLQWLDAMRESGAAPADAGAATEALLARFAVEALPARFATTDAAAPEAAPAGDAPARDWVEALRAAGGIPDGAASALRYAPDPGCFLRGEDPLALLAALPGLLALRLMPVTPWPDLAALDPFACRLIFLASSAAPPEAVAAGLHAVRDRVEIRPLAPTGPARSGPALSDPARAVLEAQLQLLAVPDADGAQGRLAAAGTVAANVLRRSGQAAAAARIGVAGGRDALAAAIARVLEGAGEAPDSAGPAAPDAASGDAAPGGAEPAARAAQEPAARALRVDVERIDALVRLAGELTAAKNALGHTARLAQDGAGAAALAAMLKEQQAGLDRLAGELQRAVLALRVMPLGQVFRRFPRLVREMAAELGKPVALAVEGEATEADRTVAEGLAEPLLHVLRNAVGHGIEPPVRRAATGKPAVATIRLRAAREGENVVVEVEDDGAGIDVGRVRAVAASRGLASVEALAAMSDAEATGLIFAPGFSTAAETTALSGRGVGMDAVRSAVERLGGRVGVESRPGQGTRVRFTLPFSVMLTRVMTVEAGGQVFGLPLDAVVETARIARDRILPMGAGRAFTLRGRTVPLLGLAEALGAAPKGEAPGDACVVVAASGGHLGALEVDRLGERMDVMLRPADGLLAGLWGVAGTTLLGDGRVLIVLDLAEILQ